MKNPKYTHYGLKTIFCRLIKIKGRRNILKIGDTNYSMYDTQTHSGNWILGENEIYPRTKDGLTRLLRVLEEESDYIESSRRDVEKDLSSL